MKLHTFSGQDFLDALNPFRFSKYVEARFKFLAVAVQMILLISVPFAVGIIVLMLVLKYVFFVINY